jgi:predicted transcriptional regulator
VVKDLTSKFNKWLVGEVEDMDDKIIVENNQQLRKFRDPDNEQLFEGVKDLKGILDGINNLLAQAVEQNTVAKINETMEKTNALLGEVAPILKDLNSGAKFFQINLFGFKIKISLEKSTA